MQSAPVKSAIVGVVGPVLSDEERALFAQHPPFGFILFKRNCILPDQVRKLVDDLRSITGRADTPILIDQEGGRVSRLKAPVWEEFPPAAAFGRMFDIDRATAVEMCAATGKLMGEQARALGITVNCAPMLDVPTDDAHAGVIGDRAFAHDPSVIATLGTAYAEGLRAAGVMPVIKHIPGHGRATADSHEELPVVKVSREQLEQSDFYTFRALNQMPLGMTAHVLYPALDNQCATMSKTIINDVIRGAIGFDGLLMADDLAMDALTGTYTERTQQALEAGNDVVLYCREHIDRTAAVLAAATTIGDKTWERWKKAGDWLNANPGMNVPERSYQQVITAMNPYKTVPSEKSGDSVVASL